MYISQFIIALHIWNNLHSIIYHKRFLASFQEYCVLIWFWQRMHTHMGRLIWVLVENPYKWMQGFVSRFGFIVF